MPEGRCLKAVIKYTARASCYAGTAALTGHMGTLCGSGATDFRQVTEKGVSGGGPLCTTGGQDNSHRDPASAHIVKIQDLRNKPSVTDVEEDGARHRNLAHGQRSRIVVVP